MQQHCQTNRNDLTDPGTLLVPGKFVLCMLGLGIHAGMVTHAHVPQLA